MDVLIACHEKIKKKFSAAFQQIEKYWDKEGYNLTYNIRNDENAIRTTIDVKKIRTDYLIVVDALGFDTATTQGSLSYNNYAGIVLFLFLTSAVYEKYKDTEMGLNCYVLLPNPQYQICKEMGRVYNTYKIPSDLDGYDWNCFSLIRSDAVENERVAKKEFQKNTKMLETLDENERNFGHIKEKMNNALENFFQDDSVESLQLLKDEFSSIDQSMQLVHEKLYTSLDTIIEIWNLEKKGEYSMLFFEPSTWDVLTEKYSILVSAISRFILPADESAKEEALEWIVANRISPFAIMLVLERVYECNDCVLYQYFASIYQIMQDEKSVQLIMAYSRKYQ